MHKLSLWHWRAITPGGHHQQGEILAPSRAAALKQLSHGSLFVVSLRRTRRSGSAWHIQHKVAFIRQLGALIQAGVTLPDALALLGKQHNLPTWRALITQMVGQINQGHSFGDCIAGCFGIFPAFYIAMIRTGETTGQLEACCLELANQQEQQFLLQKKVKKALRYPAFVMAVSLLVMIAMLAFVLPEFAAIYRGFDAPLPSLTLWLLALSGWVSQHWFAVLMVPILTLGGWVMLRRYSPPFAFREQQLLLKLPLVEPLLRGQRLGQIFTMLALTQKTGLPLTQGLELIESSLSWPLWKQAFNRIKTALAEGVPLSQALGQELVFTPLCKQFIQIGEETGQLDDMLARLAAWHGAKASNMADTLAGALEPVLMIVIGTIIGTLVLAMYLPIFQLGEIIG